MQVTIGQRLGTFEVSAVLGEGGMGKVWRATNSKLGRQVALKVLPEDVADDPDRHARFEREAKVLASLNHPNIATLFGLEHLEGKHVLVMEVVEGEDLSERIARGPIPIDEAIPIALQISEAPEAAHEAGIVHRDLKPANIKVRPDGVVKVLDFGLAKAWDTDAGDASLSLSPTLTQHATAAGVILGTAAYMAPEQAAGIAADRRADIWAFGVVLWEMLTGRKLFDGETVSHVLASVLKDEPDLGALPDGVPPRLVDLVERCLREKPRRRLQAIGDARVLLDEYTADPDAFAAPPADAAVVGGRGFRWWAPALALALLAGAVGAGYLARRPAPVEARVVRFTVDAPAETTYHLNPVNPGPVAVSPDGRSMVFAARGPEGVPMLYRRQLDARVAQPLAETEGAQYPFWSPDSRSVGFIADGKLKKVDADGGPAISLCDAPNGKGGAWSPTGCELFYQGMDGNLFAVTMDLSEASARIGAPEVMISIRPSGSAYPYASAADGERFLVIDPQLAGQSLNVVLDWAAELDGGAAR